MKKMAYGIKSHELTKIFDDVETQNSEELKKEHELIERLSHRLNLDPKSIVMIYTQVETYCPCPEFDCDHPDTIIEWAIFTAHGERDKTQYPEKYAKLDKRLGKLSGPRLSDTAIETFHTWLDIPSNSEAHHKFTKQYLGKTQGFKVKYGVELHINHKR